MVDRISIIRQNHFSDIDVIIAANENISVIRRCLDGLLKCGFHKVHLCLDTSDDQQFPFLSKKYPEINLIQNGSSLGKIKSQLKCLSSSNKNTVLIIDADILIHKEKIEAFVDYFYATKTDFLCPYSVGESKNSKSLLYGIAESDRIMRQRVVRAGRDAYNVSNLSGYCLLANRLKYMDIIDSESIQDDVIATINLFNKGYSVRTYHDVICSELERISLKAYFLQKTRWTAGNILLLKKYYTLFESTSFQKSVAFSSSFLLWYWALWVDFCAFVLGIMNPIILVILSIEFFIKYIGLINTHKSDIREKFNYVVYIFVWPIFSFICLLLSPYYLMGLITEKKTRR